VVSKSSFRTLVFRSKLHVLEKSIVALAKYSQTYH
jgi:hypothetical protein